MDKYVENKNISNINSTPLTTSTTTTASGTSSSSQVIDVKNNPKALETNPELAAFIKSDKFKQMTPEKQIEALKKAFFPNSTPEEIKQYLNIARQAIQRDEAANQNNSAPETTTAETTEKTETAATAETTTAETTEKTETAATAETTATETAEKTETAATAETTATETAEKTETAATAETTATETAKKTETATTTETAANDTATTTTSAGTNAAENTSKFSNQYIAYAKKKGLEVKTIDDIIAILCREQRANTLDDEGRVLLKRYENRNSVAAITPQTAISDINTRNQRSSILKDFIPDEILYSTEWQQLSREEQLLTAIEFSSEKYDVSYTMLETQEEKDAYIKNKLTTLIAESSVQPEQRLKALNSGEIDKDTYNNILKTIGKNIARDNARQSIITRNQEMEKQIQNFIDKILTKHDPKYKNLPPEEKEAYAAQKVLEYIRKICPNFDKLTEAQKSSQWAKLKNLVQALNKAKLTIEEAEKLPILELNRILAKNLPKGDEKEYINAKIDIIEKYIETHPENKQPSYQDLINYLEEKGKLTNTEKQILTEFKIRVEVKSDLGEKPADATTETLAPKFSEEFNEKDLDNFFKDKVSTGEIIEYFGGYDITQEDFELIEARMKKAGYSDEEIKQVRAGLRTTETIVQEGAIAAATGDTITAGKINAELLNQDSDAGERLTEAEIKNVENPEQVGEIVTSTIENAPQAASFCAAKINEHRTEQEVNTIAPAILKSPELSNSTRAVFTQSLVETAPTPQRQLSLGKTLSGIDNPSVTEGLAAASKSVDKSVRSQYNNYVETAAKNYPPETQAAIKTAMKTGQISQETLSQTTPSAPSSTTSQTQTTQNQTQSNNQTGNNTAPTSPAGNNAPASAPATAQSAAAAPRQNTAAVPNQPANNNIPSATANVSNPSTAPEIQTAPSPAAGATRVNTSASASASTTAAAAEPVVDETAQLEQMRKDAALNAQETADNIKQSIDEHEAEQEIRNTVDEVIEQLAIDGNITLSEKEAIKQQLLNAGSISKFYEIVSKLGAKEMFLDRIVKSSTFAISAFINNVEDSSVVEDLYLRCSIDTIKKELLGRLPQDRIHALMQAGKIHNLSDLDYKVIQAFILKNIGTMHYQDFKGYAQYLPGDVREKLEARFKELNGMTDEEPKPEVVAQNSQDKVQDETTENPQLQAQNAVKNKPKTTFNKNDQMIKTLNDGTRIKRATFAGVSDVIDDNTFEVIPDEKKDKTQAAMNDEVLTPGSDAWREKYGRYEYQAPATSFTMAALEEDEEGNYGLSEGLKSTKVRMGQKINKNIRFNA